MTLATGNDYAIKVEGHSLEAGQKQSYVSSTTNLMPAELNQDVHDQLVSLGEIKMSQQSRQKSQGLSKEFTQFTSQYGIPIIRKQKNQHVEETLERMKDLEYRREHDPSMVSASTKDLKQEGGYRQDVSIRPASQANFR